MRYFVCPKWPKTLWRFDGNTVCIPSTFDSIEITEAEALGTGWHRYLAKPTTPEDCAYLASFVKDGFVKIQTIDGHGRSYMTVEDYLKYTRSELNDPCVPVVHWILCGHRAGDVALNRDRDKSTPLVANVLQYANNSTPARCPIANEALWLITPPRARKNILAIIERQEQRLKMETDPRFSER